MKCFLSFVLGLSLVLFACLNVEAQQPDFLLELPYPNQLSHEKVEVVHLDIAPKDNSEGCCFIAASEGKNPVFYETDSVTFMPIVYKVSAEGYVIGQLELGYKGRYSMVVRMFEDPDDAQCCIAVGFAHDNDLHYDRPFMAKFDHNLNLLWQKEIELPEPYRNTLFIAPIMDSSNDIVCCLSVNGLSSPAFCRLNTEGELVAISNPQYPCNEYVNTCGSLFEFRDGSGDYGRIVDSSEIGQTQRYLIRINRELELVSNTIIPNSIHDINTIDCLDAILSYDFFVHTNIPLTDGSIILGASGDLSRMDYGYNWTYDAVVAFLRFNPDGSLVSYSTVGQGDMGVGNDSIKAIQGAICHAMVEEGSFYFYHTVGEPGGWGHDWTNCFVVTKMDIDGNVIWQRYWDRYHPEYGMKVYCPNFITTTSDKGCLVSGYSYHSDIYGPSPYASGPDVFMLKFFSDGTLAVPKMEEFVRPYAYWPNPAQDQLHLQFSPDVTPTQVELYDLQGRLLRSQRNGLESLDLQGLAPGTYTMRVTLENGKAFSDKVVKE